VLHTPRLRLVPATVPLARAEIADRAAFAALLGARVPDNWPPESAADALPWFLEQLEAAPDERVGWLAWYGVRSAADGEPATLVGGAGFLGPPVGGTVYTGYSVLPQFHNQGYATEMVGALVDWALTQAGVRRVVAETGSDNGPSVKLLARLGFHEAGAGEEAGHVRFERSDSL
jgi:[ribosomal protein S5]-alanine N-acetyltransferase